MTHAPPMPDTDRDPIPASDAVPEGAGGLTDQPSVADLPAPRAPHGGGAADPGAGSASPAPSQGSVGAMDADPTADRSPTTSLPPEANPTAPAEGDPTDLPRDDTPPVGTAPADAMGRLLDHEGVANPSDPDGVDETDADGLGPADAPRDQGLAESPGPGGTPPLG